MDRSRGPEAIKVGLVTQKMRLKIRRSRGPPNSFAIKILSISSISSISSINSIYCKLIENWKIENRERERERGRRSLHRASKQTSTAFLNLELQISHQFLVKACLLFLVNAKLASSHAVNKFTDFGN